MEDLKYYIGSFIGQVAVNKLSQPRYESIPLIGKKYIICRNKKTIDQSIKSDIGMINSDESSMGVGKQ